MNILALDLGTHTGYCHTTHLGGGFYAGTWDLATAKEVTIWGKDRTARRCDPRVTRLFDRVMGCLPAPNVIVFEDVQFQTYTYQTQLWASLRAAVWLSAYSMKPWPRVEAVPVGTLKKFATGYHGANKELMAKHLYAKFPGYQSMKLDDNAVDAIWLYKWAEKNLGRLQ